MANWLGLKRNNKEEAQHQGEVAGGYASFERSDKEATSPGIAIIDHVAKALFAIYNMLSYMGMLKYKELYYGEALHAIDRVLRQEQFKKDLKSTDPIELARRELKEAIEELGKMANKEELGEDKRMCEDILDKLKNNGEKWPAPSTLMIAYVMLRVELNNSLGPKVWFGIL